MSEQQSKESEVQPNQDEQPASDAGALKPLIWMGVFLVVVVVLFVLGNS